MLAVLFLLFPVGPALAQQRNPQVSIKTWFRWGVDCGSVGRGSPNVEVGAEYAHSGKDGCRLSNVHDYGDSWAEVISRVFTDEGAGYSMCLKLARGCTTYCSAVIIKIQVMDQERNAIGEVSYGGNILGGIC